MLRISNSRSRTFQAWTERSPYTGREYFRSSGGGQVCHVPATPPAPTSPSAPSISRLSPSYNVTPSTARHHHHHHHHHLRNGVEEAQSVRSGSGFWAACHDISNESSAFSAMQTRQLSGQSGLSSSACASGSAEPHANDSGDDSDGTEIAAGSSNDGSRVAQGESSGVAQGGKHSVSQQQQGPQVRQTQQMQAQRTEDVGSQDAFIAGMIYALSQRLLPGAPYAPGLSVSTEAQRSEGGRWKLGECLRCVLRSSRLAPLSG